MFALLRAAFPSCMVCARTRVAEHDVYIGLPGAAELVAYPELDQTVTVAPSIRTRSPVLMPSIGI